VTGGTADNQTYRQKKQDENRTLVSHQMATLPKGYMKDRRLTEPDILEICKLGQTKISSAYTVSYHSALFAE
jgi:hypothetical protein